MGINLNFGMDFYLNIIIAAVGIAAIFFYGRYVNKHTKMDKYARCLYLTKKDISRLWFPDNMEEIKEDLYIL